MISDLVSCGISRKRSTVRDPLHWSAVSSESSHSIDEITSRSLIPELSQFCENEPAASNSKVFFPPDDCWDVKSTESFVINDYVAACLRSISESGYELFAISVIPSPQAKKALEALSRWQPT